MTDQFQNRKGKWWKQRPTRYLKHTYYTTANSIPQTHVLHDNSIPQTHVLHDRQLDTLNTRITRPPNHLYLTINIIVLHPDKHVLNIRNMLNRLNTLLCNFHHGKIMLIMMKNSCYSKH